MPKKNTMHGKRYSGGEKVSWYKSKRPEIRLEREVGGRGALKMLILQQVRVGRKKDRRMDDTVQHDGGQTRTPVLS